MDFGVIFLSLWLFLMATTVYGQTTIQDDTGVAVTVHGPAERIISLAPHVTELLYAAGAGAQIVAAVEYSDYPAQARDLPRIGNSNALDLERIISLQPDLIVGWHSGNPANTVAKLRSLGMTVFMSEPRTFDDIAVNIEKLGWLARTENIAQLAAVSFREELKKLRQQAQGRARLRVFYQISYTPLFTVNGRHLISQALDLCGGDNIFAALEPVAPQVSEESVIQANPQIIIGAHYESGLPSWGQRWRRWQDMDAVRYQNIFTIHPDVIARHTPRILLGTRKICEYFTQAAARLR